MLIHYLKIAFRNLRKYKLQSIISITGLAVGFVCFTLSMLWIRYETGYDSFHKEADLIYRVRTKDPNMANGLSSVTPYPLANYLKNTFPEIKAACTLNNWEQEITIDGKNVKAAVLLTDSAFFDTFSVSILSGNKSILQPGSNGFAITDKASRKWFGQENPVGKKVGVDSPVSIEAVTSSWSSHSNIPFDIIKSIIPDNDFGTASYQTYIRLQKGTDVKALLEKLSKHQSNIQYMHTDKLVLTPITSIRYTSPDAVYKVKFSHVILFAVAGGLVILCSLFNFLTLFISRIRIRGKELALRKVSGAGNSSFLFLLCTEVILTLLLAILMGILLMEWIQPRFMELAGMQNKENGIFGDVLLFSAIVTTGAFLVSILPVHYFRRKTLLATIQGKSGSHSKNLFRKGSILLQLIISIGLMFCTCVLFKQIYFLSNSDLGLARKNVALLNFSQNIDISVLKQEIKKLPGIREVLDVRACLFPQSTWRSQQVTRWEDMPAGAEPVQVEGITGGPEFIGFYNFTFIKGRGYTPEDDPNRCIVVNETLCKRFGWHDPIGKKYDVDEKIVIGVIKDYYNQSPVIPPHPVAIFFSEGYQRKEAIVYKYLDNQKENSQQQIQALFKEKFPEAYGHITYSDEKYAEYIQSEKYLLLLMGFISAVCLVVCAFGVYSLASLTTEEKRKSIAIRKVNGASTGRILNLFFLENLLLLCIASAVAFPAGYIIMKPFLESYATQTDINVWIFLSIFLVNGLIMTGSIFSRVWKAANENPAEVVKSE